MEKKEITTKKEYDELFEVGKCTNIEKHKEALKRAWKNRDFEIEMYWKRATYFWVFIATTFAAYFALQTIKHPVRIPYLPINELIVISLGMVFSLSWVLVNKGSKKWQENWEAHIDMLENEITGDLYKTVLNKKYHNYSVSKINLYVSHFVFAIWIFLFVFQWLHIFDLDKSKISNSSLLTMCYILSTATICLLLFLYFTPCLKRKDKNFKFKKRPLRTDRD